MAGTEAYNSMVVQLLPPGRAWDANPNSLLGKLLYAFSSGMAEVEGRLSDLLEEADPRTAAELIDAWEALVGLPDACTGALEDIALRRAAIWARYTNRGGQSREHFRSVAAGLGYDIRIIEYDVFRCDSRCDEFVRDTGWAFAWTVVVKPHDEDTPDLGVTIPGLECIIEGAAPAHTTAFFAYPAAPVPTFYFDFIEGL